MPDCSSGRPPGWLKAAFDPQLESVLVAYSSQRRPPHSSPCPPSVPLWRSFGQRPLPLALARKRESKARVPGRRGCPSAGRSGAALKRIVTLRPSSAIGPAATAMHRLRPAPRAPLPPWIERFRFLADGSGRTPPGWLKAAFDPQLESVLVAYTRQRRPPHSTSCPFLCVLCGLCGFRSVVSVRSASRLGRSRPRGLAFP